MILTFRCIVSTWRFGIFIRIFIWDTAGMKTCSETERCFRSIVGWMTKIQQDNLSQNLPQFMNILIPILMRTQSDSYFKQWFLCSQIRLWSYFQNNILVSTGRSVFWSVFWALKNLARIFVRFGGKPFFLKMGAGPLKKGAMTPLSKKQGFPPK